MKRTIASLGLILLASLAFAAPGGGAPPDNRIMAFTAAYVPYSLWNGDDFSGELFFSDSQGVLAIPSLEPGMGWGLACGIKGSAFGKLYSRSWFSASQTFHKGTFLGEAMNASSLLFSFDYGLGYAVLPWLKLYAGAGWIIPYYLFVDNGYRPAGSAADLAYFGMEGIEAGFGADIDVAGGFFLTIDAMYRMLDYRDVDYGDNFRLIEYVNTGNWIFRIGAGYMTKME